jgi:hypothetical protein
MCNQIGVRFVVAAVEGRYVDFPAKALFAIAEALVFLLVRVGNRDNSRKNDANGYCWQLT